MHIVFNRDEQKVRVKALLPEIYQQTGLQVLMPLDPAGGGSWIAANQQGWICCLLNDYSAEYQPLPEVKRSRGLLVTALVQGGDWHKLDLLLQTEQLTGYAPFRLLLFVGRQNPLSWSWNGSELRQSIADPSPISSSSTFPRFIPWLRSLYWRMTMAKNPSADTQLRVHQQAKPWHAFSGIAMQRQRVQTVSITRLTITNDSIRMDYWDGYPSTHDRLPDKSVLLPVSNPAPLLQTYSSKLDVKALFKHYSPALYSRLKPWQMSVLRCLLAEQRLNQALGQLNTLPAERFCDEVLQRLTLQPQIIACRWPLPASRPVFICNHPTGGIDGLLLISVLQKRYPDLLVVANQVLGEVQQLAKNLVAVPVFAQPKDALPAVQAAFAGNAPLLIFPAGRTARRSSNQLDDGPWAKLAVTLARREQRSLTLLHLRSENSRWFYLLAWLRQKLRIKANLEMLLLVREMLKPSVKQPQLFVDIPMHSIELDALADTDRQRISWLKRRCYQLPAIYQETPDADVKPSCSRRAG
ncbi:NRDE family protein [Arsukibacterium sp.]|uniref:NRDE family protein n=1 Tax=Arsukibacterium sp. TaxID=1977258 RepID=UPI003565B51D